MGGFVENITEGLANAAHNDTAVNRIEKAKADRRATSQEEVQAQAQSILTNVKGVQDKIAALGPNPDPKQMGEYQAQLHTLRQDWTDLFHPVKNPGNLGMMGKILQAFRGQQGPTALTADRMARGDVAGAAGTNEFPGLSSEDANKARRVKYGLDPRATQPGENWLPFDGTFQDGTKATLLRNSKDGSITDLAGNPVPPEKLATFNATPKGKPTLREAIVPDPTSETGFAKEGYDAQGNQVYRVQNVVPPRGALGRETTTTDPFGVTTTSTSKPVYPGGKSPTGKAATSGAPSDFGVQENYGKTSGPTYGEVDPKTGLQKPTTKKPGEQKKDLEGKVSKSKESASKLDEQGHIPATERVNSQLRTAANNLLDGMDVDKLPIPQKDRAAAQELAEKYGWKGQGLFTPKDQLLLRESETYLDQALKDPSLKVLDSATSRLKLMNALSDNPSIASNILASTWKLNPDEANFLSMYRQLVGTISGLGQLTRANRTTEAAIKRLMSELPNPREVQSSEQAMTRIKRLQSELTVARQKGYIPTSAEGNEGQKVLTFNPATGRLE